MILTDFNPVRLKERKYSEIESFYMKVPSFIILINLFLYFLMLPDNNRVMGQYTDQVEEQHAYIKETVDTVFPSNIKVLQVKHQNSAVSYK